MAIWDAVTKPVRGIGRLLRGKFREGFDDLGEGAKAAAVPVSFVNPLLGAGLALAGNVADKATDPGGLGKAKLFKDFAAPAALTYGAGQLGRGIGSALMKGGQVAQPGVEFGFGIGQNAAPAGQGIGRALLQAGRGAGNYIAKNPEVLGYGMQAVGAYRDDQLRQDLLRDEKDKRARMRELLNAMYGGQF